MFLDMWTTNKCMNYALFIRIADSSFLCENTVRILYWSEVAVIHTSWDYKRNYVSFFVDNTSKLYIDKLKTYNLTSRYYTFELWYSKDIVMLT